MHVSQAAPGGSAVHNGDAGVMTVLGQKVAGLPFCTQNVDPQHNSDVF